MSVVVGALLISVPFLVGATKDSERGAHGVIVNRSLAGPDAGRPRSETCRSARRAVSHYRALTWERQELRRGRLATRTPLALARRCHWARYAAGVWKARARAAATRLEEWLVYHYAWEEWLPLNWQLLGACETGYGQRPGNFAHANSSFVSAFGISRSIYGRDADYHGVPHWDDENPPTPREQYLAALGHLALWGDGWTCPGP